MSRKIDSATTRGIAPMLSLPQWKYVSNHVPLCIYRTGISPGIPFSSYKHPTLYVTTSSFVSDESMGDGDGVGSDGRGTSQHLSLHHPARESCAVESLVSQYQFAVAQLYGVHVPPPALQICSVVVPSLESPRAYIP